MVMLYIDNASVSSLGFEGSPEEKAEAKAKAEAQEREIEKVLGESSGLILSDIKKGRSRFGLFMEANQEKGLSWSRAAGKAAMTSLVPMPVAGFFRRKSVQENQLLESQKLREQDWAKNATSLSKELSRDPYDTSDAGLEMAIEQQIKRAEALKKQKDVEKSQEEQQVEGNKVVA